MEGSFVWFASVFVFSYREPSELAHVVGWIEKKVKFLRFFKISYLRIGAVQMSAECLAHSPGAHFDICLRNMYI